MKRRVDSPKLMRPLRSCQGHPCPHVTCGNYVPRCSAALHARPCLVKRPGKKLGHSLLWESSGCLATFFFFKSNTCYGGPFACLHSWCTDGRIAHQIAAPKVSSAGHATVTSGGHSMFAITIVSGVELVGSRISGPLYRC